MLRLTTILVLLVLVVTVTPVAADTITFLDGTESVSVVTVGDRAHAFQSCDESSCGALLNAPAGAVNQISFFIVIGDPDGVTISDALVTTFNFVPPPLLSELIVTFVSDSDDPGGPGPCAAAPAGCEIIENGQIQTAITLQWFDLFGGLLATDTIQFQSDIDPVATDEPATLLLLASGVAGLAGPIVWRRRR